MDMDYQNETNGTRVNLMLKKYDDCVFLKKKIIKKNFMVEPKLYCCWFTMNFSVT